MVKTELERTADLITISKNLLIESQLPSTKKDPVIEKLDEVISDLEEVTNLELRW